MPTALSPTVAGELRQRLADICAQASVDPTHATFVKYTMNAVFIAPPYVLRLADGAHAVTRARHVVTAAQALTRAAAPTIRLADDVGPQPVRSGDWVATIWQYVPTVDTGAKPADLAEPLRKLHAIGDLDVALPTWAPVEKFRRRIDAAAALPPQAAAELRQWSRVELGLDIDELLQELRRRCDDADAALAQVDWHLPPGVIHGDAHTGNVILPESGWDARGALLCDLDGVCHGPREWDLVPTAHSAARFGYCADSSRAFVASYGFDVTTWSGWPVLRDVRELQLVTSTINTLTGRPEVAAQLAHRLRSLLADDPHVVWSRFE